MSIQQDINSAIGQVGILAALNPTLQAKAKDREELGKIKKQEKVLEERDKYLGEEIKKESANISAIKESEKKMSPEELKFNEEEIHKMLSASEDKVNSYAYEIAEMQDKKDELTRMGYNISPKKYKERYFEMRQREVQSEIAEEAQQRAEEIAQEKALLKEKRTQYQRNLHRGIDRTTIPGFRNMSKEQQESIIKKIPAGERRKIANEEKWRKNIYG